MSNIDDKYGVVYKKDDYASLIRRVVIAVTDIIVIAALSAASLFITSPLIEFADMYLNFNMFLILSLIIWYFALLKRSKFRTIGYRLAQVKIVDLQGKKPSIFKMIIRALLLILGPFEFIIDLIWLTSETTKQTLRDKYVGTYVVDERANPVGNARLQTVTLGVMGLSFTYREVKENSIK